MFSKTKHRYKKHYYMSCLQNFVIEEILDQHKKQCLLINGCQEVNYESGIIKFKSSEKPIIFKIYADTECFLERTNFYEGQNTIKNEKHTPYSRGAKFVCIDDRFTLPTIIFKGEKYINEFIKLIFRQKVWISQLIYQYFNKELIMTNEDEDICHNWHICWICKEELNTDKIRDYSTATGKFRGASHSKCHKTSGIPKKLPITFHNLQGYDGHLIFKELNNFNVDIEVIPKSIDKYKSIIVNRSITFIDSLQFCNNTLDALTSNLKDEDFRHLISEFGVDKLGILKR